MDVVAVCAPQDERPRLVKHYQYFSWPDHGVPNEPGGVLSFLDQVNRAQRSIPDTGPIIVHCRYGPGGWQWGTAVGMGDKHLPPLLRVSLLLGLS